MNRSDRIRALIEEKKNAVLTEHEKQSAALAAKNRGEFPAWQFDNLKRNSDAAIAELNAEITNLQRTLADVNAVPRPEDDQLATLKRQLAELVAPIGMLHNVPALPPHFLHRPEALDTLRELVIDHVDHIVVHEDKPVTAIDGMGCLGKSVLAAAFAHDRKVRFAFPDGIVWLTAGHRPSMYELYRAIGVALGDELSNYPDETTARQNAQKALADKKCLLILDDVWELSLGRAFRNLISGTSTRLLITTRNLQINDVLNANEYRLKLIDKSQAVDYLRSWAGNDPKLGAIAEKLGYLFLALKLAGARMRKDGLSGADYLRTFDRVSRMKIDRQASDREDSLEASIRLSVDAAFASAEDEKLFYHSFGIFPADTPIPLQTLLQLWQQLRPDVDEFYLLETLNELVDLSLVERNANNRNLSLHELLHSYTREKLGDQLISTHHALLDSYKVEMWYELSPKEPYLWHQLAYHLNQVNRTDILRELLTNWNYLQAKLNATDVNVLLREFDGLTDDNTLHMIENAISLDANWLNVSINSLVGHVSARLASHLNINPTITRMMTTDEKYFHPGLLSQLPTLRQAGSGLIRTMILTANTIEITDDGEYIVAVLYHKNEGSTLGVLEWKTREVISTVVDDQMVSCIVVSGEHIFYGSNANVKIWNWHTGKVVTLNGHKEAVVSIATAGNVLVSASESEAIVWNWERELIIKNFPEHASRLRSVSVKDHKVFCIYVDGTTKLWNWRTGEDITTRKSERSQDSFVAERVALSGNFMISRRRYPAELEIYNWYTDKIDYVKGVEGVTTILRDLVVAATDTKINIWDIAGNNLIASVWDEDNNPDNYEHYSSNKLIIRNELIFKISNVIRNIMTRPIRISNYLQLQIWNLGNKLTLPESAKVTTYVQSQEHIRNAFFFAQFEYAESITISGNLAFVAVNRIEPVDDPNTLGEHTGKLKVWKWKTNDPITTFIDHMEPVHGVATVDNIVVSASDGKSVVVQNSETGAVVNTFTHHKYRVYCVAVHGERAISGSYGEVFIWNWKTGDIVEKIDARGLVGTVVLSDHIAYFSEQNGADKKSRVTVYDLKNRKVVAELSEHSDSVNCLKVQGDFVFSASRDNTVKVWNWRTGVILTDFQEHMGSVNSIFVAGEIVCSGSSDHTIKVWQWNNGNVLTTFQAKSEVNCVAYEPEQRLLLAGDGSFETVNNTVHVFKMVGMETLLDAN
jgi:WD40 repeat protein